MHAVFQHDICQTMSRFMKNYLKYSKPAVKKILISPGFSNNGNIFLNWRIEMTNMQGIFFQEVRPV